MEYIDMNQWIRKEHFDLFYSMEYPQFNVCVNIDVTDFLRFLKDRGLPFYYALIYHSTMAVNEIPEFHYRIRDGKVVVHDRIQPSFTYLNRETELFKCVNVDMCDTVDEFCRIAKETAEKQKEYIVAEVEERDDLIYYTCTPWFSFTQLNHPVSLRRDDSILRISWGKYFNEGDKILLPLSFQANHALVDGLHVGKYIDRLQSYLE